MNWQAGALKEEKKSVDQEVMEKVRVLGRHGRNPLQPGWCVRCRRRSRFPLRSGLQVDYIIRDPHLAPFDNKGLAISRLRSIPSRLKTRPRGISLSSLCSVVSEGSLERILGLFKGHFSCNKKETKEVKLGKQL